MKNRILQKYLTLVLLIAMAFAVVPIHDLIHEHHSFAKTEYSEKSVQLKKHVKSCVKSSDGLVGTVTDPIRVYLVCQAVFTFQLFSFSRIFITPVFHLSNKAPPVAIA